MDRFIEDFYAHLAAFPATAQFLQDPTLIRRLKTTQKQYFDSLLDATFTPGYVEERRRIGRAHADVGLAPQWFLGAFNLYIQHCFTCMTDRPAQEASEFLAGLRALLKFIMLDVGLALDAYYARSTEQLDQALQLYAQSNTALREFAQLASHDLKTPLATVASLCEEFLDEFGPQVPAEGRQLIEAARTRAMKMKGMIDALLAASEAAAQPGQRARLSTRSLLDEVLARIRLEAPDSAVRLEVPDDLPEVYAHPGRLHEVFYQLLANAVKFTERESGVIRVSVARADKEWVFCIADNGPGIPAADLERIFAPFQRLAQHRHLPGSGLGLYFVRMIVEEQGGWVRVESTVGQGSKFYFALPISRPSSQRS
jgi:signal transduction histidine kinase